MAQVEFRADPVVLLRADGQGRRQRDERVSVGVRRERGAFIQFLQKSDLFDDKIKSVPIKAASCFSCNGGSDDDREANLRYINGVFNGKNENVNWSVFTHVANATGKGEIEKVYDELVPRRRAHGARIVFFVCVLCLCVHF